MTKTKNSHLAEHQLWDFKRTLEMWHITARDAKDNSEHKFAELIAALANAEGGVLIVGVSDAPPRIVEGIGDVTLVERRVKHAKEVIKEYTEYPRDFVHFHQLSIESSVDGISVVCLLVAVARTCSVVGVKDKQGRYTYPKRFETGFGRVSRDVILTGKLHLKSDSFDFLQDLNQFVSD